MHGSQPQCRYHFRARADARIVPNISQTGAEISTLISLVDAHIGIALLPASAVILYLLLLRTDSSVSEVKKRDDQDQSHEDGRNERDTDKPGEHKLAVAGVGRRLRNTHNIVKSPK
jgi:hypothetical protein